jgi:hypothetical protein
MSGLPLKIEHFRRELEEAHSWERETERERMRLPSSHR